LLILGISLLLVSGLSVAYGAMSTSLGVNGQAAVKQSQPLRIVDVQPVSPSPACGFSNYPPLWEDDTFQVDGVLTTLDCQLEFTVTVKNAGSEPMHIMKFVENSFNNSANMQYQFSIVPASSESIVPAGGQLDFTVKFGYRPEVASLPSQTDFTAIFTIIFGTNEPPLLTANNDSRNFEIFRGSTTLTPASLASRLSALDDLDGDITDQITASCATAGGQTITCPTTWASLSRGDYNITYNVSNSLGAAAAPITLHVKLWDFIEIDAGSYHTVALTSHGKVYTWGYNNAGQIGDNTVFNRPTPFLVPDLSDVVDIGAGEYSSFAVLADGTGYAWGEREYGQICDSGGSGGYVAVPTPITVPSGINFTQVDAYHNTVMWRASNGDVYICGDAYTGSFGTGAVGATNKPTKVQGLSNIKEVAGGTVAGIALDNSGYFWTWGASGRGRLGSTVRPAKYNNLSGVTAVSGAFNHMMAVANGKLYTWGTNASGSLCNGSVANLTRPTEVKNNISGVKDVDGGYQQTIFVTDSGAIYTCGYGGYGKLGNGTVNNSMVPYQVTPSGGLLVVSLIDSQGYIDTTGNFNAFGYNGSYQFGSGDLNGSYVPVSWLFEPDLVEW
jgi:alpha-tubulin suppressor-like RCC1 family protein